MSVSLLEIRCKLITLYLDLIGDSLVGMARLDEIPEPTLPVKYPRTPGYRPPPEENKYNAW